MRRRGRDDPLCDFFLKHQDHILNTTALRDEACKDGCRDVVGQISNNANARSRQKAAQFHFSNIGVQNPDVWNFLQIGKQGSICFDSDQMLRGAGQKSRQSSCTCSNFNDRICGRWLNKLNNLLNDVLINQEILTQFAVGFRGERNLHTSCFSLFYSSSRVSSSDSSSASSSVS